MRPCRSDACHRVAFRVAATVFFVAWHAGGCSSTAKERQEFKSLETAIGLLAIAKPEDRPSRLEQLEKLDVKMERIVALKRLCASAYRSFERASSMLISARAETDRVEADITEFKEKKALGVTITAEEEQKLRNSGARAAESIRKVTKELDLAEGYVASCDKKRAALKDELLNQ